MNTEKECRKCNVVKPLSEFYKCRGMADGHFNQCKACKKIYADSYTEKNIEVIRAKGRERMKNPERAKICNELTKAWKKADLRRQKCHTAVKTEIRAGRLKRQPCVRCGNEKSIAHHEDYDRPLYIVWLCAVCHKQRHKEILMEAKSG